MSNVMAITVQPAAEEPRNDLEKFCGMLRDVDCTELEATQYAFNTFDEHFGTVPLLERIG